MNQTSYRPLSLVENLVNRMDNEITHLYEDLVFTKHSDVILQYSPDQENEVWLFSNQALSADDLQTVKRGYMAAAQEHSVELIYKGTFIMEQKEDAEEVELQFFELE
jgi:hypothetical protein